MPKFILTVFESTSTRYEVEADTPEQAEEAFEDCPEDATEIRTDCLGYDIVEVRQAESEAVTR